MATLAEVCENCKNEIKAVFDPNTGSRTSETIAGDLYVSTCCFVRDEIRFLNNGRLIFGPGGRGDNKEYCREYVVVCRKLVVVGGNKPGSLNPCGPDDPGSSYATNNVITWADRLKAASPGPSINPAKAADGQSFDPNGWQDQGQGNNGRTGGNGADGQTGNNGGNGRSAPKFTLLALEVEIGAGDHLTIDFDGQTGGDGGVGQRGGDGGRGMGGRPGESDTSWPGTGCDRQPGSGGGGGRGGNGGVGGTGGRGGDAGSITVLSYLDNISGSGAFVSGKFTYVCDGATGGLGGLGGYGGRGGNGGNPGFKTSECDNANTGAAGPDGFPAPGFGPGSQDNKGAPGAHGAAAPLKLDVVSEDSCARQLPLPIQAAGPAAPNHICRGFSTPETVDVALSGANLAQVEEVTCSLAGVTPTIKASSTDTQLDLKLDIAGNSALGNADLTLKAPLGINAVVANAFDVKRFEVLSVAPNTGARGDSVAVTITGQCFDPLAAIQQVNLSGAGVNAVNIIVLDETTVQCVLEIGNVAAQTARNLTVKTGAKQHTLLNAFTVTA